MEQFQTSITGLWMFVVGYAIHWVLYVPWRKGQVPEILFIPLGIVAWISIVGLLFPFKDFVVFASDFLDRPTSGGAFTVGFYFTLFMLIAWGYQNADVFMLAQLKPFLRDSLFFRHSKRIREDVFAKIEQKEIQDLVRTQEEQAILTEPSRKKRVPMDRKRELDDLENLRKRRTAEVGKEEITRLNGGGRVDITDICKLHHVDTSPHPTFDGIFQLTIDASEKVCRSCVVFSQEALDHINEPKKWFRFRQDLFDHSETLYLQTWMERFKHYFSTFEIECYREETDSFGLPQKTPVLRMGIPVSVLEEYKQRLFIATELENVATLTWLNAERQ